MARFVDLPGANPARVDADAVVCARVETSETGSLIIIHTTEGFAFPVVPTASQSTLDLYNEVHSVIWPETSTRKTRQRS